MEKRFIIFLTLVLILLHSCLLLAEGGENKTKLGKIFGSPSFAKFNINNVSTWIYNNGSSDIDNTGNSGFTYPKFSAKTCFFQSGFVWGGKLDGVISVSGSVYKQGTRAGRIVSPGIRQPESDRDVRIYRVRTDIPGYTESSKLLSQVKNEARDEGITTAEVVAQYQLDWNEWPAAYGAPYSDVNKNGVYDSNVDIPGYPGADQTIWFVNNDLDAATMQNMYGALPVGIEQQVTFWGYNVVGGLGNTVFRKYKLINKNASHKAVTDMYVSMWSDPDNGDANDDFVGIDTTLSLQYIYNAKASDATYGLYPPAAGFCFVQGPKIKTNKSADTAYFNNYRYTGYENLPLSGAYYFVSNGTSEYSDPTQASSAGTIQFYNLMQGKTKNGNYFPVPSNISPRTENVTNFPLSGDPVTGTGYLDGIINVAGDRRMGMASGPFTLAYGDTQEVVVAQLAAGGIASVNLNNINAIKALRSYSKEIISSYRNFTGKFSIFNKTLELINPNSATKYKVGTQFTIEWKNQNVERVKIEYTTNSGSSWNLITDNTDSQNGKYNWTIPNTVSTQCRIKISDSTDPTLKDESDNDFSIYDPKINITYPTGSEIFYAGSYIDIKWSSSSVNSVRVEYTTNNGVTWSLIKNHVSAIVSILNWNIPSVITNNCKIRIRSEEDTQVESTSLSFSIKQNLFLTYPNGGEIWQIGNMETIKWTSNYVENIKIDFSSDQGASWNNIIQNISANVGSYVFPVPNAVSSSCLIKISDVNNPSNSDESDKTFKISKYTVTLNSPNGNEIWQAKTKKNITWSCNFSTMLSLMYSIDEGITWQAIANDIQSTTSSYLWDIPQINSAKCKIMVVDMNDPSVYDSSDKSFTITSPNITVKTPNGNESWYAGELKTISWNSNFVTDVSIEKSTNGGLTWDIIIGTLTSSVGVFYWKVTEPYSNNCRIRIKSNSDSSIKDESDNSFSIISPVGVNEEFSLPKSTCLFQNYPNPFNPNTEIRYQLDDDNYVTLTMYNALGVEIVKLVNEWKSAGLYRVRFDGSNYPSGIYYYRLQVGKYSETKKTILMK